MTQYARRVLGQKQKKIFEECVKKGVREGFCNAFWVRMMTYPLKQTKAFFACLPQHCIRETKEVKCEYWRIYLEETINIFPEDEKTEERREALKLYEKSEEEISLMVEGVWRELAENSKPYEKSEE